jgi:phosphatidylserine decarboxylase
MPHDKTIIRDHVNHLVKSAKAAALDYADPINDLSNLINSNPIVYMLFNEMLSEVPTYAPYNEDPSLQPEIRDVTTLLDTINFQIQTPIKYNDSVQIGTPINAILDWPMGTKAGFAAFLRDDVNACFKAILQQWGAFLKMPESLATVTTADGGWLSAAAQNDPESPGLANFLQKYEVPDANSDNYGFTSWDAFFIRQFLPGLRPVASPTDSTVVVSAAESTPFYIQTNVQLQDQFWAKDQHYALDYLLGDPDMAQKFVGGTVYQAFLSADSYHNWHAPVAGTWLAQPRPVAGTYYSEPLLWGFSPDVDDKTIPDPDAAADARSQGYISCVAKRGVGFIQPDDTSLGIIAVVMIGMAEVSSIEFDNLTHFNKGDMIGRFHFGGSTHCLVFQPGVTFTPAPNVVVQDPTHVNISQPVVPVCSTLGTLTPANTQ